MLKTGFIQAWIIASKETPDCPFIIKVAGIDDNLFDPINLDEKYMKYAKKIWLKYRLLRMKNRRYQANLQGIEEKQKRAENNLLFFGGFYNRIYLSHF